MNNDEAERILNDFILNEDKKLQKLIDTLERIEKAGRGADCSGGQGQVGR